MNTFYLYWILALVLKLIIGASLPYSSDESYYWVWSQHLQLGYFDHPGMIAWINYLGQFLDGFGPRWPSIFIGHLSWIVLYQLFKKELQQRLQLWCWFMLLNPLLGWGLFLAIPDTPAVFFWSLSTLAAARWVELKHLKWAACLGIALGLGFNSKYHMVLFVPCFLLWLTWTKQWRNIPWPHVPVIIVTGLVCSLPVLIWNYQNNFDSFLFQLKHGLGSEKPRLVWPLEYLGSQVALLFPTVFFVSLKRPESSRAKFLYVLGWFPVLFFLWTSFSARPEGNWPILGYSSLLTLAVLQARSTKFLKVTASIWGCCFVVAMSEAYLNWLPIADKSNLKTFESIRYDDFLPWIEGNSPEYPNLPVYASSFQMAATLHFKSRKPIYKLKTLSRRDHYDYLPEAEPPKSGRFLVLANRETDFSATILKDYKFIEEKHFASDKKIMVFEVP